MEYVNDERQRGTADDLPEPEEVAADAIAELERAVAELSALLALLDNGSKV